MSEVSIPKKIPVLPSPHIVLFPHTHLSLHLPLPFYERLRQSTLPGDFFLGLGLRREREGCELPILPIGCAGVVVGAYPLACGKSVHLDLMGLKRFEVKGGKFDHHFGLALIEEIRDRPGLLSEQRKKCLLDLLKSSYRDRQWAPGKVESVEAELADEAFLNLMCLQSDLSVMDKYFLLEAEDLNQRCGRLIDLLRFKMQDIRLSRGGCPKDY